MTFGLPQPRMAGSKFFPPSRPIVKAVIKPTKPELGPIEKAIRKGFRKEPNPMLVELVEAALAGGGEAAHDMTARAKAYRICREVCARYDFTVDMLFGRQREARLAYARQQAMWLVWRQTGMSSSAIGRLFRRDHSTVLHAVRKCEAELDEARAGRVVNEQP